MAIVARQWVPSAAIVPQERGEAFLAAVDGAGWSEGVGFYRGFFSAFRLRAGRDMWFHVPLPTPVERNGRSLSLASVSLLWETLDDAEIGWLILQHGGAERLPLTERLVPPASEAVPFDPPEQWQSYYPPMHLRLTEIAVPLPLRFGVQLCIMVRAPARDGTFRFYGAGAAFSDD
jgi:hypothetical protein